MIQKKVNNDLANIQQAVDTIKTAILQSQARAAQAVNQEQLALYFGIGRYVSANTRNKNWGQGMLEQISERLRQELPGLRGFSERHLKNMRTFYEAWTMLEPNSAIAIAELEQKTAITIAELPECADTKQNTIRQLHLTNLPDFPLTEFFGLSFTHHIRILESTKDLDERLFYIRYCYNYKPTTDRVKDLIQKQAPYHHQDAIPNNFVAAMPDYKQAYRAIQMFKDEYLLDFINVEELGMRDEDVDERVGIILCKSADKAYVEYVMQDFRQPMGVATYKTADEIDEEVLQVLPPKEQLQALLEQQ